MLKKLVTFVFQFISIVFLILASSSSASEQPSLQFNKVLDSEKLGSITVSEITEDADGFIWFIAGESIKRFDGFDVFSYVLVAPEAQESKILVKGLMSDNKGRVWLRTTEGVFRYDKDLDKFTAIAIEQDLHRHNIDFIGLGRNGEVWAADTNALYQYNEIQQEFTELRILGGQRVPARISSVAHTKDRTWIGTAGDGLFYVEQDTDSLKPFTNPKSDFVLPSYIKQINILSDELLIIPLNDSKIFFIDSQSLSITPMTEESNGSIIENKVTANYASQLINGDVLLATREGIMRISRGEHVARNITQSETAELQRALGARTGYITHIHQDSSGSHWIGTLTSGLIRYVPELNNVDYYRERLGADGGMSGKVVWGITEDTDSNLWIGTFFGGVNKFNRTTKIFTNYLQDEKLNIFDVEVDSENKIWVATASGVHVYEEVEGKELKRLKAFLEGHLFDRLWIDGNKIWIHSDGNHVKWIDTRSLEEYQQEIKGRQFETIRPIYFEPSLSELWFATEVGLKVLNVETNQLLDINLPSVPESSIPVAIKEIEGSYWIVTNSSDIAQLDADTKEIISTAKHRQGNIASAVFSGDSVWLGTDAGIVRRHLHTNEIQDEVSPAMLYFNEMVEGAAFITADGKMVFGGANGFHMFDPSAHEKNQALVPQQPIINQLKIFDHEVTFEENSRYLKTPIHFAEEITLESFEKRFYLRFSVINPIYSDAVYFRYKLDGEYPTWVSANSDRMEVFENLSFGTHELLVQSSHDKEEWSVPRQLKINVTPPLWLQNKALVVYACIVSMLFVLWLRQYQVRRANTKAIQESEERLKLTLWSSGDELWDWDIYLGQVHRSNMWGTIDFPQDDIRTNSSYEANIDQNDIPRVQKALQAHLDGKSDFYEMAYRTKTFKGHWIWVLDRGKVVQRDNNNQPLRMTGTLKNISHLKQAEEQLKLFKRSIETISDGVFIADTKFRFISVNKAYCQTTGETREQALASFMKFNLYPEAFTEEVKKTLRHRGNWLGEVESRRLNGEKYEMELNIDAVKDEDGKVTHYVGVFSDISSRKSTEKELLKLANTDPLTELPNRSFFQASHSNLVRRDAEHALVCLDMDNFKKINDSLGHQTGDILIKQIARRLQKITGNQATCYRLGGDEFSVLMEHNTDVHSMTHFVQKILDDMARPFIINKQDFVLGASVGIAMYPGDGLSPQELLKNADTAMYFAKNAGGNNYQFYSTEMNQNAVRQLQIENLIRSGLKDDLFTVYYQPKVDIATGKLVSMEALVRFEHPEKGIVRPDQFIPLAEQTGQIVEIGEQVLRKACEDTKRWVSMGLFTGRVAVNISARQFELPDLDDRFQKILNKADLSPLHLECEITEGTLMGNPEQALRMMERLREKGIHLALDDFGTGYSSLAYLKKFPLNTLKIDKAFIEDIANSSVDRHLTASIINIAHNLGLKVVAEGVEEESQLAILRRYECEMLQGYLYSKPLSSARFERLLKENLELHNLIKSTDA